MKIKNLIGGVLLVGIGLSACKKTWLDVNTNPNSLPSSTPNFVFAGAAKRTGSVLAANEIGSYWSGQWTQSSSYIYSAVTFAYQFSNTDFNYWDNWYDILGDFNYIVQSADAGGQPEFKGPSKVMEAYIFQQLVDHYGNIPFSDALKGVGSLAPKFDDQKAVYEGIVKLLDDAVADLKANAFPGATAGSDIVFKGSNAKWIRFANSLRLRVLIRQSRIAGRSSYITAEINKVVADGFLASGEDVGVNPGWLATAGKTNPLYDNWGYDPNGATRSLGRYPRITAFLVNKLIATGDTFRLKRIAYAIGGENTANPGVSVRPEIVANYKGVPYGAPSGYTAGTVSAIGPAQIVRGVFNKPMILMTAAESFLLQAEAKQLYDAAVTISASAQSLYEQGVKESFRLTGAGTANANQLLTSGIAEADWSASPDKLKAIWYQKWVALADFGGAEAWAEYRRTNYPNIPASAGAATTQLPPVRLFYPATELGSNEANVKAQGTIDVFSSKIFWDVD